jgi:predicted regulator of Ras-like GTPase activity (Roadblock/LC7/MglB family)
VYNRILADLQQTPQVLACLLVDESGFVVAETYAGAVAGAGDSEASAALSISIFRTAAESMRKIKLGALERVIVETAAEKVFLRKAGSLLLLLSAEKSVKMGLVAVNSKRAVERIASLAKTS